MHSDTISIKDMTQTIEEIIHGIVDSMQIGYVHETVYGAYHDLIREAQNTRILFVEKMKLDDKLDRTDVEIVESLKRLAKTFIKGARASALFSYVSSYNWQVRLNAFDANMAVLELTSTLRQEEGECVYG